MSGPLRLPRLATLSLAWVFTVIAACVGLNALIKSERSKRDFRKLAPASVVVDINTNDVTITGHIITISNLLLGILTFAFIIISLLPATKAFCVRTLRLQALVLLVLTLLVLGSIIPYEVFYHSRGAKITAYIGTTKLPDSVIQGVEKSYGLKNVYSRFKYLKLLAVLPWFAILFSLIAAATLFVAGSKGGKECVVPPKADKEKEADEKDSTSPIDQDTNV